MGVEPEVVARPPKELVCRPRIRLVADVRRLWRDRGLIRTLAERDLKARYKQSLLGAAWALLTPLLTVVVFTLFFRQVAQVDVSGDVPYPLFAYVGLVPWSFFTSAVSNGAASLVSNSSIVNKTFCAREVFPLSGVVVAAADALVALVPLAVLFAWYGYAPALTSWWVPLLAALTLAVSVGLALAASVAVVYVRDVRQVLGSLLQAGLFLTPVAYELDDLPESLRGVAALNPFVAIIDSFRRVVLSGQPPKASLLVPAAVTCVVLFAGGYVLFRRLEGGVADVA